jgi:hypothetical protein
MKKILLAALAFTAFTPLAAHAQERMSDARYIAAQQCLAYAELSQLASDPIDFAPLREAVSNGYRSSAVASEARENARRVRGRANNVATFADGVQELRGQRDEACAAFVERGLVHNNQSQGAGAP